MSQTELMVKDVGAFADRILKRGGIASVYGTTSRGCFLMARSEWVLFITQEGMRGPLTLNLAGENGALRALKPGTPVKILENQLEIEAQTIRLQWGQAQVWQPPTRPAAWLSPAERRERQAEVAILPLDRPDTTGYRWLVSSILGLPASGEVPEDPLFSFEQVERLQESLISRDVQSVLPVLEGFLGRGPGLTPSGDDVVAGLSLALHRWGDVLCPDLDLEQLNLGLLPAAYRKTTTLSANLIECATQGQADERLVTALDGLVSGEPGPAVCAALLQEYGSSSGRDAFLGMMLAEG